uniref:Phosphate import ATP-binding protein PstB (Phosphate-transporting ATPase)) n=1 Tax=Ganoderma boninense TaxID=34458 RepID=A0A5K1K5W1_9APHY|nr:Phosphate import ATP-binding protein PstB (EC (ABC phosphate transporter) (Phosphate-transporting ATPase) [Ganoderma boninense]
MSSQQTNLTDTIPGPAVVYTSARQFPSGTTIINPNHSKYYVHEGGMLMRVDNLGIREANDHEDRLFFFKACALLPNNGLAYVKARNAWLMLPHRLPKPVILNPPVPGNGNEAYWIIRQEKFAVPNPINDAQAVYVSFNATLANSSNFAGSGDPALPAAPDGRRRKIVIAFDMIAPMVDGDSNNPIFERFKGQTDQVNSMPTKGPLAMRILGEIEKSFDFAHNDFLALTEDGHFIKKITRDDLLLVDIVQRSSATFQPTIAVRVRPEELMRQSQ